MPSLASYRLTRVWWIAVALLAVVGLVRSWPLVPYSLNTVDIEGEAAPLVSAEVPEVESEPTPSRSVSIGRGGNLSGALDRLGAPPQLREELVAIIGAEVDLRRLSPLTGIAVAAEDDGSWSRLAVRPEADRYLEISLENEEDPTAAWVELPVDSEVWTASGEVQQSVAQALAGSDHGNYLTLEFADIFQWDVDLLVDPRQGDQVQVVYTVHRLGAVPALLPEFGDAPRSAGEVLGPGRVLAARYTGATAGGQAFWVEDGEGGGNYYDAGGRALRKTFLKSPLNYRRISSRFSGARRNPVTRRVVPHHGVDYAADAGTPVVAAADGRVIFAGWDGPLGKAVRIKHGSEHETVYGHLKGFAKGVGPGVRVTQNSVIGYVGATGRATGPHLHYTVLHRNHPIDPLKMENPPEGPLAPALLPVLSAAVSRWQPVLEPDSALDIVNSTRQAR